jgi:SAM-dependent methyltransferase
MHEQFLPFLVDPQTGEDLVLTVAERQSMQVWAGTLDSPTSQYPIIRGVPRFVPLNERSSAQSFSGQWRRWRKTQFDSENIGRKMEGHTTAMWRRITGQQWPLEGAVIADFGCGSGRFIEVTRSQGGKVIALDLSDGAEIAGDIFRHDPDVLVCQADILRSPIRKSSVDGAYSIGVLHHTPDPRRGALSMCRSVRSGGWVGLAVYGHDTHYARLNVELFRRFFGATWPLFGPRAAMLYTELVVRYVQPMYPIAIVGKLFKTVCPSIRLPDPEWSRLDTFDSITPKYQSLHTVKEVFGWAREGGISCPSQSNWGGAACRGTRA